MIKPSILASAILAFASAFGYVEYDITKDGAFSDVYPRHITSAYCINPGSTYGVSESISFVKDTELVYSRPIKWYRLNGSDVFTNEVPTTTLVSARVGASVLSGSFDCKFIHTEDTNDPRSFKYERTGPIYQYGTTNLLEGATNFYSRLTLKTDTDNYKSVATLLITNLDGTAHAILGDNAYIYRTADYNVSTNVSKMLRIKFDNYYVIYLNGDSFMTIENPSTNLVEYYDRVYKYTTSTTTTLFSMNVGTNSYAITNNVNFVIPANTKIRAIRNDAQTKVGIICE